jgi:hypothetical protein
MHIFVPTFLPLDGRGHIRRTNGQPASQVAEETEKICLWSCQQSFTFIISVSKVLEHFLPSTDSKAVRQKLRKTLFDPPPYPTLTRT